MEEASIKIKCDSKEFEASTARMGNSLTNLENNTHKAGKEVSSFGAAFKETFETVSSQAGIADERIAGSFFQTLEGLGGRLAIIGSSTVLAGYGIYTMFKSMADGANEFTAEIEKFNQIDFARTPVSELEKIQSHQEKLLESAKKDGGWLYWFTFGKYGPGGQIDLAKKALDEINMQMQQKRNEASKNELDSYIAKNSGDERQNIWANRDVDMRAIEQDINAVQLRSPKAKGNNTEQLQKELNSAETKLKGLADTLRTRGVDDAHGSYAKRIAEAKEEAAALRLSIAANTEINNLLAKRNAIYQQAQIDFQANNDKEQKKLSEEATKKSDKELAEIEARRKAESAANKKILDEQQKRQNEFDAESLRASNAVRDYEDKQWLEAEEKKRKEAEKTDKQRIENAKKTAETIASIESNLQATQRNEDQSRINAAANASNSKMTGNLGFAGRRIAEAERRAEASQGRDNGYWSKRAQAEREKLNKPLPGKAAITGAMEAAKSDPVVAEIEKTNTKLDKIYSKVNTAR